MEGLRPLAPSLDTMDAEAAQPQEPSLTVNEQVKPPRRPRERRLGVQPRPGPPPGAKKPPRAPHAHSQTFSSGFGARLLGCLDAEGGAGSSGAVCRSPSLRGLAPAAAGEQQQEEVTLFVTPACPHVVSRGEMASQFRALA